MMFILEEDYYFITLKILAILSGLDCTKKSFVDYRKLSVIFQFIRDRKNLDLFDKAINTRNFTLFENERLTKLFCDSNMDINVIKRFLFFLEKQDIVKLEKNNRFSCIDVSLIENNDILNGILKDIVNDDIQRVKRIQRSINRIRSLKFETLQAKIFGYGEVAKWED
jgi:hypothetical protein